MSNERKKVIEGNFLAITMVGENRRVIGNE